MTLRISTSWFTTTADVVDGKLTNCGLPVSKWEGHDIEGFRKHAAEQGWAIEEVGADSR